jgi:hypothetical protein
MIWPFDDPPNVAVFTTKSVIFGRQPVFLVTHNEKDGAWQFLPRGGARDVKDGAIVLLREMIERDATLAELADLPVGWRAWRKSPDSPWLRGMRSSYKRLVLPVEGNEDGPPFCYTIGNHPRGLPELLVFCSPKAGTELLDYLSDLMIERGRGFDDGELIDLGGKVPCKIIHADERAKNDFTIQVGQFFGTENYDVQQVLVPDPSGRFPGEPNCALPYGGAPLLRRKVEP